MIGSDIPDILELSGIKPGDMIVLHADAIVCAQFKEILPEERIDFLIDNIIDYLTNEGTLVVPAFSYSFTEGKDFNLMKSPSLVGQFSERFRRKESTVRSNHPIFSFSSIGKNSDLIKDSSVETCFGKNSAFDILYQRNAKIVYLGCPFERITFVHYVEQKMEVSYRYFKNFSGLLIKDNETHEVTTEYFVRDMNINSSINLSCLKKSLEEKKLLNINNFGRFEIGCVRSSDFYDEARLLILRDEYALIREVGKQK